MAQRSKTPAPAPAPVPLALRVGGGFMALALVLIIFGVLSILENGWMGGFDVTPRFVLIVCAAALVGAFVTTSTEQRGSRSQVIGLAVALVLLVGSRFVSADPLVITEQYWIFMYAVAAILCALVLRRSLMPKA
ncbi:membrane protein [Corynebacterium phocae]|uniref:Membrane protein n=1 Tax=Corynebacterium phocae TaxID=161895 RepID=A0A1L7D2X6_9CORY|nr:hypothetical protein [Corynebacterium phocae]APT92516.1 membrane protein [Corynebacterium phocae]KAA8725121.1 hypothetical protein F4V58_05545 [Corynebacterium phocae]